LRHQIDYEVDVMDGRERRAEDFFGTEEMVEICPRVVSAGIATAFAIYGSEVAAIVAARDIEATSSGIDRARARLASWRYAIKGIRAILNASKEISRLADTQ